MFTSYCEIICGLTITPSSRSLSQWCIPSDRKEETPGQGTRRTWERCPRVWEVQRTSDLVGIATYFQHRLPKFAGPLSVAGLRWADALTISRQGLASLFALAHAAASSSLPRADYRDRSCKPYRLPQRTPTPTLALHASHLEGTASHHTKTI